MDYRNAIEVQETYDAQGLNTLIIKGRYRVCRVYREGNGWTRFTSNGSKHGIRYQWFPTDQKAFDAGLDWANRKLS